MRVQADLRLNADQTNELLSILECTEEELQAHLHSYASAALEEYVLMFLGERVFKRGSDMREYRLLLLIQHAFGGRVPTEDQVCRLFQTTESESRSLIRSVLSKYQYQLRSAIEATLRELLENATHDPDADRHYVTIRSVNLVDEFNRRLSHLDGSLPQVSKKRGSVSTYELAPSSYARLSGALNE